MDKIAQISTLLRANKSIQNKLKGSQLREAKKEKEILQFSTSTTTTKTKTTTTKTETTIKIVTCTASDQITAENTPPSSPKLSTRNYNNMSTSPINNNDTQIIENTRVVINDMQKNIHVHKNHRKWSFTTMSIFAVLFLSGFMAYKHLNKSICTPSLYSMYCFLDSYKTLDVEKLTDINRVANLMHDYRKTNNIRNNTIIPGVLAVDAVSLTPHITIDDNGNIKGIKDYIDVDLNSDDLERIKQTVKEQENLIRRLRNATINCAFVYYFQPLDPMYKCFPVFILGESSAKASTKQANMLETLACLLKENNFSTLIFAADGDNGYYKYVQQTIDKWDRFSRPILNFNDILFSNDVLHLIKRGRYILLSHSIVLMNRNDETIKNDVIMNVLDLPISVFDNSKITKMHDSLPLKLFTIKNFLALEKNSIYNACAYFLPFTLLIESITAKDIDIDTRVDLLEVAAHYLVLYKEVFDSTPEYMRGAQQGSHECVLFGTRIINDLLTTIISINSVINNFEGSVSLNRIGTNPLEHHFGLLRLRCKFNHSFSNFVEEECKVKLLHEIENNIVGNVVTSRRNSVGEIIDLSSVEYGGKHSYSNREMAYSILCIFGVNVSAVQMKRMSNRCFLEGAYLQFLDIIRGVAERNTENKHKSLLNSKDLAPTGSSGAYINQRQQNAKIVKVESKGSIHSRCESVDCRCDSKRSQDNNFGKPSPKKIGCRQAKYVPESQPSV